MLLYKLLVLYWNWTTGFHLNSYKVCLPKSFQSFFNTTFFVKKRLQSTKKYDRYDLKRLTYVTVIAENDIIFWFSCIKLAYDTNDVWRRLVYWKIKIGRRRKDYRRTIDYNYGKSLIILRRQARLFRFWIKHLLGLFGSSWQTLT